MLGCEDGDQACPELDPNPDILGGFWDCGGIFAATLPRVPSDLSRFVTSCLHPLAAKAPHFSRLGDVEVNAGQNATFQCVAAGKAAEAERFLMQVSNGGTGISTVNPMHCFCNASVPPLWEKTPPSRGEKGNILPPSFKQASFGGVFGGSGCRAVPPGNVLSLPGGQRQSGEVVPAASVKHISHRRFLATFQLDEVSKEEQDLYRCVTQSSRGSGVSNFAELIVKGG